MATTYWAVKRAIKYLGGSVSEEWWNSSTQRWDTFRNSGNLYAERLDARRATAIDACSKLVRIVSYSRDETRARREARGAVAALDTVLSSMQRIWSSEYYDGNVVTLRDAVRAMAADARRRAGIK